MLIGVASSVDATVDVLGFGVPEEESCVPVIAIHLSPNRGGEESEHCGGQAGGARNDSTPWGGSKAVHLLVRTL